MKSNKGIFVGIFATIFNWFYRELTGYAEEKYVNIRSAPARTSPLQPVPFARHKEVPILGKDRDKLIRKAEELFPIDPNDELRLKWLLSIHTMRRHGIDYIMEPKTKEELLDMKTKFPKWGLVMQHVPQ